MQADIRAYRFDKGEINNFMETIISVSKKYVPIQKEYI